MQPEKATPINELPQQQPQYSQQPSYNPNSQYSQQPPQQYPQYPPQQPPQTPNFQEPVIPQNRGQQQPEYTERQFVPTQPEIYQQQPSNQPLYQSSQQPVQQEYQKQNNLQKPENKTNIEKKSILQDFMSNWKILLICAIVLFVAQQEPLQELVRKLFRVIKVPENIVFYVSKLVISLIFVLIFFFTNRNF